MSDDFNTEAKKERPDLGAAFIATNKKSPQSYDMSGTIGAADTSFNPSELEA